MCSDILIATSESNSSEVCLEHEVPEIIICIDIHIAEALCDIR